MILMSFRSFSIYIETIVQSTQIVLRIIGIFFSFTGFIILFIFIFLVNPFTFSFLVIFTFTFSFSWINISYYILSVSIDILHWIK